MREILTSYMTFFNLGISIFAIYSAFKGEGLAYKTELPIEIKKDADKLLRIFLSIIGSIMLAFSVLCFMKVGGQTMYFINIVVILIAIITFSIIFNIKFGKEIKKLPKKLSR